MTDVRELLVTVPLGVYNEDTIIEQCRAANIWLRKGEDGHTWMYSFIGTSEDLAAFLIEQFGIEPDDVGLLLRSYFDDA